MIPINDTHYPTPLSFKKTAKLLQALVDKKDGLFLSTYIQEAMDVLIEAQKEFVEKIDNYLHSYGNYSDLRNYKIL